MGIEKNPETEGRASYAGASFALLTKHAKERAIAPRFEQVLGASVRLVDSFDTDTLATFTRDVPRFGSQIDAARRKAELAIELSGIPLGLGSEGSFAPGPFGLVSFNLEMLTLIDRQRGLEITGAVRLPGHHSSGSFDDWDKLTAFAEDMKFPSHAVVLRPNGERDLRIRKDIADWDALHTTFQECVSLSERGIVFVESDLRAHRNPSRMQNIGTACDDLLSRMLCVCPACAAPGFGLARYEIGLPCAWCSEPTNDWKAQEFRCVICPHLESHPRTDFKTADPTHCPFCNP
jgi:hypothetical protein